MDDVSCSLPAIPDGRVSRVRFWPRQRTSCFRWWVFHGVPRSSAGSHPRRTRHVGPPLRPGGYVDAWPDRCRGRTQRGAAECPEPLCPAPAGMASKAIWEGVTPPSSLIRAHAPDLIPPRTSGFLGARSSQVAASPCCDEALPDVSPVPLARSPGPIPRRPPWVRVPTPSPRAPASRYGNHAWRTEMSRPLQLRPGAVFRGGSHLLRFRLSRSLGPQTAPTAVTSPGRRAFNTTQNPAGCPTRQWLRSASDMGN